MEAPHRVLGFLLFVLSVAGASLIRLTVADGGASLSRCSFPPGFLFGTASAAYQYEGAVAEGGRGPSIWDTYTQQHPEKIADGSSGSVAVDFYHRYKEDIATMKDMGMDAFRFSISWSRILPTGSLSGGINYEGIAYYNNVINELLSKGLQPFVTLFHWDSPQGLEDQYGGFLSPNIVEDYINYVDICFREFGDRVKHWITFNEPWSVALAGYQVGFLAPGRCTSTPGRTCDGGNSKTEPYIVAHHILLAHGAAVKLYRDKYQGSQQGSMGITLNSHWFLPFEDTQADRDAVQRSLDFMFGWYMDPLTRGDYPAIMRERVGDRLPSFTEQESQMIKGAFDFIGLNYYTTNYAVALPMTSKRDTAVNLTGSYNGKTIGSHDALGWLYVYPDGFREILRYTREKYNNPVIYVTENGYDDFNNASLPLAEALKDDARTSYYQQHLEKLWESISLDGVDVRGYFAWSLLDNFEWADGYTVRFGLHFVDYKDGLKRYPKNSARWFQKLLKGV